MTQLTDFLPTTKKEVQLQGWDQLDIILFSGDAYVDHPAFGAAVMDAHCRQQAIAWPLYHSPTGTATIETLKSWGAHAYFLAFRQAAWTLWSTNTRPTSGCVQKMPTVPMAVTTCVLNTPLSYILTSSSNCIQMCQWYWVE